ncbi:MAG: hypothetical protein HS111_07410 [Kofleriaceae bacterium]|nr:hypothetical protein [Kofleriaceae bacterium]
MSPAFTLIRAWISAEAARAAPGRVRARARARRRQRYARQASGRIGSLTRPPLGSIFWRQICSIRRRAAAQVLLQGLGEVPLAQAAGGGRGARVAPRGRVGAGDARGVGLVQAQLDERGVAAALPTSPEVVDQAVEDAGP